jgi:hypothetical protein
MPSYVHNPYLDGGAYGNTVDANRIGTSALTIGLTGGSGTPRDGTTRSTIGIGTGTSPTPPGGAPAATSPGYGGGGRANNG